MAKSCRAITIDVAPNKNLLEKFWSVIGALFYAGWGAIKVLAELFKLLGIEQE